MKFSTKTRYALRLMLDLADAEGGDFVSLKDIAGRQNISVKYLEQIVSLLSRAGLLRSYRGPQGGYKLAKSASEYTPGDVIRAVEGDLAVVACLECMPNPCDRVALCPTVDFWKGLNQTIDSYLNGMTLREMADARQQHHSCISEMPQNA